MERKKKLPIGIEDFTEIQRQNFYYVDKTGLIKALLLDWGKVNLFTRPRRFGKSLTVNMLKTFFEYGCDKTLFTGLEIERETKLCEEYMGKFPVISISLKAVSELNFDDALGAIRFVIGEEALRFQFLLASTRLTPIEKKQYQGLIDIEQGVFSMSNEILKNSLRILSSLLYKHYRTKVIILIDEYDVPLDKSNQFGYYEEMIIFIRNMFNQALKTNDNLFFAVLTGCLRISKESIFTGLNNLKVLSITDVQFDEYFGFTDNEVKKLLFDYALEDKHKLIKEWYDGYQFGNCEIYCPWDVLNYVDKAKIESDIEPVSYWLNSSENAILHTFFEMSTKRTRSELEKLINGESIIKKIKQELTYKELYDSLENLWSVLFTTGYLTQRNKKPEGMLELVIPNLEIKKIFIEQFLKWFEDKTKKDSRRLDEFCQTFEKADAEAIEKQLKAYLKEMIGIHDYSIRQELKENYYHGLLIGLLAHNGEWEIASNPEAGIGYSDIQLELDELGIIIEVKYPKDENLDRACIEALEQIEQNHYEERLLRDGITKIIKYGIAFCKKDCKVVLGKASI